MKHYVVVSFSLGLAEIHKPKGEQECIYDIEEAKSLMLEVKKDIPGAGVYLMQSIAEAEIKTDVFVRDM